MKLRNHSLSSLAVSVQVLLQFFEVLQFKFRLLLAQCHFRGVAPRDSKGGMSGGIPHPPNTAQARNMRFGFRSSKQTSFCSLCIYLFLGEAGKHHTSIFLSQHSGEKKK